MPYEINGSKILVTGGAGLVGSHIVDACINEGAKEVVVIDSLIRGKKSNLDWALKSGNVKFVKADITKPEAVIKAMKGCDYVFHEVAIRITLCEKDPRSCQEILVDGTFNVLEAGIKNKIKKLVFASSASVYGESSYMPMDENHPFNNLTAYGAGKIANEYMIRAFGDKYGLKFNILRYFSVYGPRMDVDGVYTEVMIRFLDKLLVGKQPIIYGSGEQTIDMTFVTDVAKANLIAAESDINGEVINIGTGNPQPVKYLVELIGGPTVHIPKRPGEPDSTHADITKAKKLLKWKPEVSFEEGVKIMLDNIDYWKDAPLWDPDSIEKETKSWFKYLK